MELQGKAVIVTGGGRGAGRAVAVRLAAAGARVIVADQHQHAAEETRRLITQGEGEAIAHRADVSQTTDAGGLMERAVGWAGRLDGLAHCAELRSAARAFVRCTASEFDRAVTANLRGSFLVLREFLNVLAGQDAAGRVVMVGSWTALAPAPRLAPFAASKAGVLGLARTVAAEVAGRGITINCVCPNLDEPAAGDSRAPDIAADWRGLAADATLELSPLRSAPGVAAAVAFLLSDLVGDVSGRVFDPDGRAVEIFA